MRQPTINQLHAWLAHPDGVGVVLLVSCPTCSGSGNVPGRRDGERANCPICNGSGRCKESVPLGVLYDLLHGNIARPSAQEAAEGNRGTTGSGRMAMGDQFQVIRDVERGK